MLNIHRRALLLASALLLVNLAWAPDNSKAQEPIVIKLGHVTSDKSPYHIAAVKFSELASEYTDGKVRVEVFPSSVLGTAAGMLEGLILGTVEMTLTGAVEGFEPKAGVVQLPYLFRDSKHAYAVLDSDIGNEIYGGLIDKGIRPLGIWESGWRHTVSKFPINGLEDMKGMKIGVPASNVWVALFTALGTNPTPVPYGEVYTGLQQGLIDGMENPLSFIYAQKFYEPAPNVALTRHMYAPLPVLISESFWQSLPQEIRDGLTRAAKETTQFQRELSQSLDIESTEKLKAAGVAFTEPNLAPFQDAAATIYPTYEDKFGADLIRKIKEFN